MHTTPFRIEFKCGYYAVLQCKSLGHAVRRAADEYPTKEVLQISPVE